MKFDAVKDFLIAEAKARGLDEYEIYFMESSEMSTETLKEEISSFSSGVQGGVSFRCIVNGQMGRAATELLTEEEMKALVARAMDHARYLESKDKAILFSGSPHYESVSLPTVEEVDSAKLKNIALSLQKRTYEAGDFVADGTQSVAFSTEIHTVLINSHGLSLSGHAKMNGAYVQAVVQKGDETQDATDWTLNFNPSDLARVSDKAVEKALSKLGAEEIPSGKYDVIISGKKMRDLLSAFSSVFSAKNAQLGMSLLQGKEGEKIAVDTLTLVDDPMREGCLMQTPFDGEGVAAYRKNVIENGTLKTLLYDLATADHAGVESTGNGQRVTYSDSVSIRPYSFYIAPGGCSSDDLKERMGDGLYITEFKGMHAGCNAVTGDFSIESAGYRIRNGKLCEAIKSFTVAGNFFDLLKQVEAIADEVEFGIPSGFTCFGSPDVLIRGMSIAGK